MTATPPKPSLVKSTALSMTQAVTNRVNALLPTVPSQYTPVTVYQAGTDGVGGQLSAPTSAFPAGSGYYGVWTAPDLNNGQPYTVQVECFGGGGGGGGGATNCGGGGGGGGEYAAESYYPVKPGQSYAWTIGVPGSAGTANSSATQSATAGGSGGDTVFDIAGLGVAGGVVAHGGTGGDSGNTGLGGAGGAGSDNSTEYGGGTGGTNLPGSTDSGTGSGGAGGTDNPVTLHAAGLLSASPVAWYVLNDASSTGQVNDKSGSDNPASLSGFGNNILAFDKAGAPSQVPAYTGGASYPASPNPTVAGVQVQYPIKSLTTSPGCILTPGIYFQNQKVTISAWITPDASGTWGNTASGSRAVIAANTTGYQGGNASGGALFLKNTGTSSNPDWVVSFYCGDSSTSHTLSSSLAPVPGTAVYVVGVFESGTMTLYVNGSSAASGSAGFSSLPGGDYSMTIGLSPVQDKDWFFGYFSNVWFANGALSAAGVSQAYAGSGTVSNTEGGAGGGASGGPDATGGDGGAGSGATGGSGGLGAAQPSADVGINTPASDGIGGAAGGSGNSGITGAPGAGGGGAGSSSSPPLIATITVPFTTAASYCGTDASGGSAGAVYNPVIQGTTGRLFTGGQAQDSASGSKNSLLILPASLAASLKNGTYTVTRVTLTVFNANPTAAQDTLLEVGWTADTYLPITYTAGNVAGSAGVVEIPAGVASVTADLTETQLGTYLQNGGAKALILGPGASPSFDAYSASTAADFYCAVYGPGAVDAVGNSLAPYLTVTYAESTSVQQGSPGGAGAIRVTYLNQAQTMVGKWNSTDGIVATGGQLTETTVVLGSTIQNASAVLDARLGDMVREAVRSHFAGARLGLSATPSGGTLLGYTSGTTTVTQATAGTYSFTVPSGVSSLSVACWGGGAGATGGSGGQGQGGGGGGAYAAESRYAVTAGQVITYTVGAGGAGDNVGSNNSPDGGDSVFDTAGVAGTGVTAHGGKHYEGTLNYGPGGAASSNSVSFSGGAGGPIVSGQANGSGGGGSAGASGNGGGGSQGGGAGAAGSGGGAAGGAGSSAGSGNAGGTPGGGGGGAAQGSSNYKGGNGGAGKVTITYVSSTALNTSIATAAGSDTAGNAYPTGVMTNALQVNGTTTTTNQTVSNTTSTQTLSVSGNATVVGSHTVDGNVTIGGVIQGSGGGTVENSSGIHSSAVIEADGGLNAPSVSPGGGTFTTNGNHTITGNATVNNQFTVHGGTSVDGSVSAGGSVTAGSGVSTDTISPSSGTVTVYGNHTVSGSATIDNNFEVHGSITIDNQLHVGGYPVNPGVITEGLSGSAPSSYSSTWEQGLANRVNQLLQVFGV